MRLRKFDLKAFLENIPERQRSNALDVLYEVNISKWSDYHENRVDAFGRSFSSPYLIRKAEDKEE